MIKLKEMIKESKIELGKVYTDKDKPPFKTTKQMKEELVDEAKRPMTKHWAEKLLGSIRNFESYWSKDNWFNDNRKIRKEIDNIHKSWKVIYKELGKV